MYLAASHVLVLVLTVPTSFTWVEPSLRVTNDSPFWSGCNIIQGSERLLCVRGNSNLQDYMKGSCKCMAMGFHCHTQCKVACFTVYNLCWKKTKTVVTACNTRLSMWINLILILHSLWAVAANKCWGQPRLPSSVVQVRYYRFTKQTSVVWVVAYPRCSCLGLTCCNCAQDCTP